MRLLLCTTVFQQIELIKLAQGFVLISACTGLLKFKMVLHAGLLKISAPL